MKKPLLSTGLLVGALGIASAVPVTFRVNMDYQISLGNFVPGVTQVAARGEFNGWAQLFLTNVPSTTLYENTAEDSAAAGATRKYKFWHNGPAGTADTWENNPDKTYVQSNVTQTVYRYFNDLFAGGPPIDVTFQVDLLPQILNGAFILGADAVEARGSFQIPTWSGGFTLTNDPAGASNIFSGTYPITTVPPGGSFQYKFLILTNGVSPRWENDPNRSAPIPLAPATLPLVTFNREIATSTPVTFQVDLSYAPNFNPAVDVVEARGSFQSPTWTAGFTLTNSPSNTNVFKGVYQLFQPPGTYFEYKFLILDNGVTERWESGANRSFVLTSPSQVLPAVLYNRANTNDLLTQDTVVSFRVNMTNAVALSNEFTFDPQLHLVYVNGDWVDWWDWNVIAGEFQLTNDVDGSLIYSQSFLIPKGNPVRLAYKYSLNAADNELPAYVDRVRYIRSLGSYTLPLDQFGVQVVEQEVGSLTVGPISGGNVTLNWNGRPGVNLQKAVSLAGPWSDVPGTAGASSAMVPAPPPQQFFRLIKPY